MPSPQVLEAEKAVEAAAELAAPLQELMASEEISPGSNKISVFPQTVCLTLGVLTVMVKGRVPRSRCRTDFVAIFVVSCLHVRFSSLFTYFRACRARRDRLLNVNFRSFRLFNFFDVRFSW